MRLRHWSFAGLFLVAAVQGAGGQPISAATPIGFFTNVANRLLANAGYTFTVTNIQIWPANFYTPSVHRLLQLAANIYDSTTNRTFIDTNPPFFPSVFRPLFGSLGTTNIYITGYQEVTDTAMAGIGGGSPPIMRDLHNPQDLQPLQAPGQHSDMVYGIPLVIGAKKGFPNFNEFEMDTLVQVTRELQFRRTTGALVNQTNQMFLLTISNVFGMEAWNSYTSSYPRDLQVIAVAETLAFVTNQLESPFTTPVTTILMSNWVQRAGYATQGSVVPVVIPANTWAGFLASGAFLLPLDPTTNGFLFTNATYLQAGGGQLTNLSATFETDQGFPVPHWWLNVRTRLRCILVDTTDGRILDYVNLDSIEQPLDITYLAMNGAPNAYDSNAVYVPNGQAGSFWLTNRMSAASTFSPTFGILNQIGAGLGNVLPVANAGQWNNPPGGNGNDTQDAISFFRGQLLNIAAVKTNVFYAPFVPTRNIFFHTSWQANDPLVHYTIADLTNPTTQTNRVEFDTAHASGMNNLGCLNTRYQAWGPPPGQTLKRNDPFQYNVAFTDPSVTKSDDWDFPSNTCANVAWLGGVHRGTPWQTIYLKAPSGPLAQWMQWSGNFQVVTNLGQISTNLLAVAPSPPYATCGTFVYDAIFSHPTNDWSMVSLLAPLFNTNAPGDLFSLNQPDASAWCGVLDGLTVLTNVAPSQSAPLIIASNSPQANLVAAALATWRSSQPGGLFHDLGEILAVPELSTASPWLNLSNPGQNPYPCTDAACEALPAQLLARLRPDSLGSLSQAAGALQVRFTGADAYPYAVQLSSNLVDWIPVLTNYPANGSLDFSETSSPDSPPRFYRSVLQ